jgi:hypothetical protein
MTTSSHRMMLRRSDDHLPRAGRYRTGSELLARCVDGLRGGRVPVYGGGVETITEHRLPVPHRSAGARP